MLKNKKLLSINIILIVLIAIMDLVYICWNGSLLTKTITSSLFVITGIVNFIFAYKEGFSDKKFKKFSICMLIGLIFAMLGDVVLELIFEIGAGLFAIGHIMFFVSYSMLVKISWRDIFIAVAIFAIALLIILLYDGFVFDSFMLAVVIVYAFIISFMLGKSIGNLFDKELTKLSKWSIFIGSLCFFLSDLCLLFRFFANLGVVFSVLCLVLYYPAEWILGTTIYYSSRIEVD